MKNVFKTPDIKGVMFNAYPDSIGGRLTTLIDLLKRENFRNCFSTFYILPSLYETDLDRGFSIQTYDLDSSLTTEDDLKALKNMGISLKLDFVLNHLSVLSPQFQDLLSRGDQSRYRDFFIDWNRFWEGKGESDSRGCLVPTREYLDKLFMRKPGLPVLELPFPDGSRRFYWNTFYQKVTESPEGTSYLGQMDLNAQSPGVWQFYRETLKKLKNYGAEIVRLDAFAYLHKEQGLSNFFNKPGTWEILEKLRGMAQQDNLILLPEIHSTYREMLHRELSSEGFMFYDFFFPGLILLSIETGDTGKLKEWIQEILDHQYKTINMLGCHDGIPLLDLKGLIKDKQIEELFQIVQKRGGRMKNLYGPDGEKISYYQVNAAFFSALGESEKKLIFARAVQLFMPGTPQIWYLDLFGGKNDTEKADREGHKEINRTDLSRNVTDELLESSLVHKQLNLIRFRNIFPAFAPGAEISIQAGKDKNLLSILWEKGNSRTRLEADFKSFDFRILFSEQEEEKELKI